MFDAQLLGTVTNSIFGAANGTASSIIREILSVKETEDVKKFNETSKSSAASVIAASELPKLLGASGSSSAAGPGATHTNNSNNSSSGGAGAGAGAGAGTTLTIPKKAAMPSSSSSLTSIAGSLAAAPAAIKLKTKITSPVGRGKSSNDHLYDDDDFADAGRTGGVGADAGLGSSADSWQLGQGLGLGADPNRERPAWELAAEDAWKAIRRCVLCTFIVLSPCCPWLGNSFLFASYVYLFLDT
jgi:hypothetical protein